MNKVRTRFAPSPTGFMHVGNLRTAIYTYLIAKSQGGDFVLRIEDTDRERLVEGAIDLVYKTLDMCGLEYDEGPLRPGSCGPYIQSERMDLYKKYAEQLVKEGKAYYCFCDEERLNKLREESANNKVAFLYDGYCKKLTEEEIRNKIDNGEKYVIRQKTPDAGETSYNDLVYGEITIENKLIGDQILLKSDEYPTYNFANVIDDYLMNITHIARGNEYLTSTPKYILLYEAFGWEYPNYVHLPQVVKEDGKKLSKRSNDASFMDLVDKGYLPEAIVNYLALLGWSPETNKEIFSLEELIKEFNISRINKAPAVFDIKKLNWVNSNYIKKLDESKLKEITIKHLEEAYSLDDKDSSWITELINLYQNEISYGEEIVSATSLFFKKQIKLDNECSEFMKQDGIVNTIKVFKDEINSITDWTVENIKNSINNTKEKSGASGKLLYMPIRIAITGQMHGPELPRTIHLLGKELVLNRLNN